MMLELLPEYSVRIESSPRGWHYLVHRGLDTDCPATADMMAARFGMCPTREQAWACALAALRGTMRVDTLIASGGHRNGKAG